MPLLIKASLAEERFTRKVNEYVRRVIDLLEHFDGPREGAVRDVCKELEVDHDMYSAVWANLKNWHRTMIKDIRNVD